MQFKYNYWYFQSVLTPRFCDDVIEYGNLHKKTIGYIGSFDPKQNLSKKQIKNIQKKRKSSLAWLTDNWIYREILPYVTMANKNAGWNFDLDGPEACQFTEYDVGEYYGWHYDMYTEDRKKTRKLSVTCTLSNPEDYDGGELEFSIHNPERKKHLIKCTEIKPRGSIIVFPSYVWHRVKPVTKGKRYSLVIWNQGDRYK